MAKTRRESNKKMSFNHLLFVVCLLYCTSISYCTEEESFYDLTAEDIHGNLVKFDKYKGKVRLLS